MRRQRRLALGGRLSIGVPGDASRVCPGRRTAPGHAAQSLHAPRRHPFPTRDRPGLVPKDTPDDFVDVPPRRPRLTPLLLSVAPAYGSGYATTNGATCLGETDIGNCQCES
jgi:hypothetical protein